MKLLSVLAVFLCMVLFAASVSAVEETNETTGVNETVDVVSGSEANEVMSDALLSGETAQAFGEIHKKILMTAEEAFDYLLTGDEKNKQAFLDEYASLAEDYAAFELTADLNSEKTAELKVLYDEMVAATDAMGVAAETMFISYDANKTVSSEEIMAFEDAVDKAAKIADAVWDLDDENDTEPVSELSARSWLSTILLEAIEESYAYPVIGDVIEKEDALARFAEFDDILAMAQEQNPDASFDDLKTVKEELMKASETFFATYEAEGTVRAEDILALETVVESFNEGLYPTEITETPSEEATTVNLTEEDESAVNATA